MNYSIENKGRNTAILRLEGRITVYQLQKLRDVFAEAKDKLGDKKRFILDLESLIYMDPLALGIIVAFSRDFREKGGEIRIVRMNDDLKFVFDLSRLSKVYEIYPRIEEAEKSFLV